MPDLCLAGEYFWDSETPPEPLFLDEIKNQKPLLLNPPVIPKEENEPEDFSFVLNKGFDASPWDVDNFFETD
ncbi:hypothetical protein Bca52824_031898 [Brassica carinata]|uniref:Uncharacterized protein n=1 Tax=Brassica carinata TaxID=52824 RepID=A0A8X7SBI6_BRACI|nr:hypothetical protein Bca52824_031898 [Brassica carinata]